MGKVIGQIGDPLAPSNQIEEIIVVDDANSAPYLAISIVQGIGLIFILVVHIDCYCSIQTDISRVVGCHALEK